MSPMAAFWVAEIVAIASRGLLAGLFGYLQDWRTFDVFGSASNGISLGVLFAVHVLGFDGDKRALWDDRLTAYLQCVNALFEQGQRLLLRTVGHAIHALHDFHCRLLTAVENGGAGRANLVALVSEVPPVTVVVSRKMSR